MAGPRKARSKAYSPLRGHGRPGLHGTYPSPGTLREGVEPGGAELEEKEER